MKKNNPKGRKKAVVKKKKRFTPVYRQPFPNKRHVTFKFCDHFNLSPATTAVASQSFHANSLFDPSGGAGSDSPRYFDQICAADLYTLYSVDEVGYRVEFVSKSASTDAICSVAFRDNNTVPADNSAHWEYKEHKNTFVTTLLPLGQSQARQVIKGRIKPWQILGTSKWSYLTDRSSYEAEYNANPAAILYMNICASDDPNGAAGANVDVYVTLYMKATVSELSRTIAQS